MAHLYTYNSFTGLSTGIVMNIGKPLPSNPSRIAPPHLLIDSAGFIGVNTRWKHPNFVSGKLLHSSLTKLEPEGKKAFIVFDAPRQDDEYNSLIFIDASMPKGMKRRPESDINAWMGIRGEAFKVIRIDYTTGAALLQCEANAVIELFQFDGSVQLLSVVNGKVSATPLTQKQMAQYRIEQFKEQIDAFDLEQPQDMRKLHGIVGGTLRLIKAVKDRSALDVLVDFLVDQQVNLTDNLRKQIRWALTDAGHPAAGTFLNGFEAMNVVRIPTHEGAAKRAVAEKRKRERAERDRQLRTTMRGGGNGGGNSQQQKKGKGKK